MSTFQINWKLIPTYVIDVGALNKPYDICEIMKIRKTRAYTYAIIHKDVNGVPYIVIKYGMSYDNSRNCGERVYRQIAHSRSWNELRVKGSSGAEWLIIEEDFLDQYGFEIDRSNLYLKIWDLTNYPFTLYNHWDEVNKIESYLINEYVRIYGKKPIGNINDESNKFFRPAITASTIDSLFSLK